jgi:hypothetical protein
VNENVPCAWQLIVDRLKAKGGLQAYSEIEKPRDWSTSRDGGPRKRIREDMTS